MFHAVHGLVASIETFRAHYEFVSCEVGGVRVLHMTQSSDFGRAKIFIVTQIMSGQDSSIFGWIHCTVMFVIPPIFTHAELSRSALFWQYGQ